MPTRRLTIICVIVAIVTSATSCGNESSAGDAQRFCGEIEANKAALTNPDLSWSDDIEPLLELYRSIGKFAPLAIEQEWQQLIVNYETASTVVPGDDESLQRALAVAFQSEKSAAAVGEWLRENCAVELPVATITPHS